MIARIWHGYTTHSNAPIYERLLNEEIFPGIAAKNISGYLGIQLLRRELSDEVEFTTIMWFESLDNVIQFVGQDYEQVYVPEKAKAVLSRFDQRSLHSELRQDLRY